MAQYASDAANYRRSNEINVDELDLCFLQNRSITANNNKMHKNFARNYINTSVESIKTTVSWR
jgi:hypothetical protein